MNYKDFCNNIINKVAGYIGGVEATTQASKEAVKQTAEFFKAFINDMYYCGNKEQHLFAVKFMECPGAHHHHHAHPTGLLEHSITLACRLALYSSLTKDVVDRNNYIDPFTAAQIGLYHDFCKVEQYTLTYDQNGHYAKDEHGKYLIVTDSKKYERHALRSIEIVKELCKVLTWSFEQAEVCILQHMGSYQNPEDQIPQELKDKYKIAIKLTQEADMSACEELMKKIEGNNYLEDLQF